MDRINWSLFGIPDHHAVSNLGGRLGAGHGPEAFRAMFGRMRGLEPVMETLADAGDLDPVGSDIAENHARAAERISALQAAHSFTVVIGGSHDHGYSHLLGVKKGLRGKNEPVLGCINIDSHLDVRPPAPEITSGSPFHLALESGVIRGRDFVEFGYQAHCNSKDGVDFLAGHKAQMIPFESLRYGKAADAFKRHLKRLSSACDAVVVSLDIDAARAADAPGVSAPQSEGFSASDIVNMMEIAGANRKVVSLGIFELNPYHDSDGRTARLCATAAWHFAGEAIKARSDRKRSLGKKTKKK